MLNAIMLTVHRCADQGRRKEEVISVYYSIMAGVFLCSGTDENHGEG